MPHIKESDWRVLRDLKEIALQRLSERALDELTAIVNDQGKSPYQRYLDVFRHIRERDEAIALCFDNLKRSSATLKLGVMVNREHLLTDEEIARFSPDIQDYLKRLAEPWPK